MKYFLDSPKVHQIIPSVVLNIRLPSMVYFPSLMLFHGSYFSDCVYYLFCYPKVALGDIFLTYCIQSNIFLAARKAGRLARVGLDQGLATVFCKGPGSKYLRLCGPYILCCSDSNLSWECESSHRKQINDWTCLCSKVFYLQNQIVGYIWPRGSFLTSG